MTENTKEKETNNKINIIYISIIRNPEKYILHTEDGKENISSWEEFISKKYNTISQNYKYVCFIIDSENSTFEAKSLEEYGGFIKVSSCYCHVCEINRIRKMILSNEI